MPVELKVPSVGESISQVEIGEWLKAKGEFVAKDETIVTLESEKATVELPAPISGVISDVVKKKGDTAAVGEVIAFIENDGQPTPAPAKKPVEQTAAKAVPTKTAPQSTGEV